MKQTCWLVCLLLLYFSVVLKSYDFAAMSSSPLFESLSGLPVESCYTADAENKYAKFLTEVAGRTGALVARWQAVGFVHGVLNTDNMSILGETIDYG